MDLHLCLLIDTMLRAACDDGQLHGSEMVCVSLPVSLHICFTHSFSLSLIFCSSLTACGRDSKWECLPDAALRSSLSRCLLTLLPVLLPMPSRSIPIVITVVIAIAIALANSIKLSAVKLSC